MLNVECRISSIKCQTSNVKCQTSDVKRQMSNVKRQMSNSNRINLLLEHTSGVSTVIFLLTQQLYEMFSKQVGPMLYAA